MELLKHKEIASVNLFDIRLSEGELMVYESCIEYVIKMCDEKKIYELTGCETKEELLSYQDDLRQLILKHVLKEYLPEKYQL